MVQTKAPITQAVPASRKLQRPIHIKSTGEWVFVIESEVPARP